jgi:hypothetical protein
MSHISEAICHACPKTDSYTPQFTTGLPLYFRQVGVRFDFFHPQVALVYMAEK